MLRVVIPFLVLAPLLYPLMHYQAALGGIKSGRIQEGGSAWQVMKTEFANQNWLEVWPIHFWFLETLILLYVIGLTLYLLFRHLIDRKQRVRSRVQSLFAKAIASPWGILWLSLPIASILFWEES